MLGDVRSPPPVSLSSQPIVTTYDLRLTTYDLRLTTYNLRPMTSQLCFTGTHPPPAVSQFNIPLRSQPTLTPLSEYPLRKQTSQHNTNNNHQQSLSSISLSSQPIVTTYDLRLTTYDFPALLYWDPPPPTTNNHQQSLTQFNCSLRLVATRLTFNRSLRLTTYDFLAGTHHHQQPPAASQH